MTTKTENLEAWEALKLLMEGFILCDRSGCKWTGNALSRDSHGLSTTIAFLIDCAPFRLAKVEQKDIGFKGLDPYIVGLVKELVYSEARNIAQDEIAKLRKEIGYGTVTISKEAIEAAKRDPRFYEPGVIGLTVGKVKGQDRGEPNE